MTAFPTDSDPADSPSSLPDELEASPELVRAATTLGHVAVWEYRVAEDRMSRTRNHDSLYGLPWQEVWHRSTFLDATVEADRAPSGDAIAACLAPGGPDFYEFDFRVMWPDGSRHWLSVRGEVVVRTPDGAGAVVRGVLIDIDHRKSTEARVERLMRLYRTLSACNQALVKSNSESEIFHTVCEAIVLGGFGEFAWIGKELPTGELHPVAWAGEDSLDFLAWRAAELARHADGQRDLAELSRRQNRVLWRRQSTTLPTDVFGAASSRRGYASTTAIPLRKGGRPVGTLSVYSRDEENFDPELDSLLEEMASDISFALDSMDFRQEELKTREAHEQSERNYRDILERASVGIYVVEGGRFVLVSEQAAALLGYASAAQLLGMEARRALPERYWDRVDVTTPILERPELSLDLTFEVDDPGARPRVVRASSVTANFEGRPSRVGFLVEVPHIAGPSLA